jgi:ArsR family transcriptional regulator
MERQAALAALTALAQESRLEVFRLLVQAGGDGMQPGRLSERLGLPAATLSFHLNHLRQSGLVTCRRESRALIYTAEYATMNALLAYLTENCCQDTATACDAAARGMTLCNPELNGAADEAPARARLGR